MTDQSFSAPTSETRFEGPAFTVETLSFERGEETLRRDVVRHSDSVVIVAIEGEDLFLVRQKREAVDSIDLLELVAGGIEEGETPAEAAQRELTEEIGMRAGELVPLGESWASPGYTDERFYFFLARDLSPESGTPDEDEEIRIERVPLARLADLLGEIEDAKSLLGLLLMTRIAQRAPGAR